MSPDRLSPKRKHPSIRGVQSTGGAYFAGSDRAELRVVYVTKTVAAGFNHPTQSRRSVALKAPS